MKPRIAVFAGPNATILNTAPLVTGNAGRRKHGLPPLSDEWGVPLKYDLLRPQRLARPATVYVEQFSAHPLEADASDLYGPPDGYLDSDGEFHPQRRSADDVPVYEIVLRPEDGLIPLPYVGRQQDGSAWEGDASYPSAPPDACRQPFYPDPARLFEEIDRLGVDGRGVGNALSTLAEYDFIRVVPSGGYARGVNAAARSDVGEGDISPEEIWSDFFPYRPRHLRREPSRRHLAVITNRVQAAMASDQYSGGLWLEGSPSLEETSYWLGLLVETAVPIVGCASADWPHGVIGGSGDRALIDAVRYVRSGLWADHEGRDQIGAVVIHAEQIFTARDVQKADARPGGYIATGGHGGIVGSMGEPGPPVLTFLPVKQHTFNSTVRLGQLPESASLVRRSHGGIVADSVAVRDDSGALLPTAIPRVSIVKYARYLAEDDASGSAQSEVEILARIERNLNDGVLSGFVVEGGAPYGTCSHSVEAALRRATFLGMPVVYTSRGNAEGMVPVDLLSLGIAGSNLTATKARLLLMACLLRFGGLPPAADPDHPSKDEIRRAEQYLVPFQEVFYTH